MSTLSRRSFLKGTVAAGAAATAGLSLPSIITAQGKEPVKVGVLHSLSGTMAISEVSLRDVVEMAAEEVGLRWLEVFHMISNHCTRCFSGRGTKVQLKPKTHLHRRLPISHHIRHRRVDHGHTLDVRLRLDARTSIAARPACDLGTPRRHRARRRTP